MIARTEIDMDSYLGSHSLRDFVDMAWHQVEPALKMKSNWHIDAICEHLEAVTRGEIHRLVINVPPGGMKSLLCSVFWPVWSWTHTPHTRWITASYAEVVARRDALKARRMMESKWFQERWGHLWRPNDDQWASMYYSNSSAGLRMATTVGGQALGEHADIQLVDDPVKPLDVANSGVDAKQLTTCIEWWDETMSSRMKDPATGRRVIIMQRLHENDLAGYVLNSGGYEHLCLPMEYDPKCVVKIQHKCSLETDSRGEKTEPTTIDFKDIRTEDSELLWPERFPPEVVALRKKEFGPRGAAAQDQQRPSPKEGDRIKKGWFRYYKDTPRVFDDMCISVDLTFKKTGTSRVAFGCLGRAGGKYYFLDAVADKMGFNETLTRLTSFIGDWPEADFKYIEDKANGPATIETLKSKISGIKAVNPQGSKGERLGAVAYLFEAGDVFFPADRPPWVLELEEELLTCPNGRYDDLSDVASMGLFEMNKQHRRSGGIIKLGLDFGSQSNPWSMQ